MNIMGGVRPSGRQLDKRQMRDQDNNLYIYYKNELRS